MENTVLFFFAAFMGLATADLFIRAWIGVLRLAAVAVQFSRGQLGIRAFLGRLHFSAALTILYTACLVLSFFLYFRSYGLGRSELEQLGYFLPALARTAHFLKDASNIIDGMFDDEN